MPWTRDYDLYIGECQAHCGSLLDLPSADKWLMLAMIVLLVWGHLSHQRRFDSLAAKIERGQRARREAKEKADAEMAEKGMLS